MKQWETQNDPNAKRHSAPQCNCSNEKKEGEKSTPHRHAWWLHKSLHLAQQANALEKWKMSWLSRQRVGATLLGCTLPFIEQLNGLVVSKGPKWDCRARGLSQMNADLRTGKKASAHFAMRCDTSNTSVSFHNKALCVCLTPAGACQKFVHRCAWSADLDPPAALGTCSDSRVHGDLSEGAPPVCDREVFLAWETEDHTVSGTIWWPLMESSTARAWKTSKLSLS